jgi:glycosyltransferase involved in cell wall biosynthesis
MIKKTAKQKMVMFLYFGNHWGHQALARAINAEPYSAISTSKAPPVFLKPFNLFYWSWKLPSGYDIYFCEETYMFPALRKEFGRLGKAKIINIVAGSLMYYLYTNRINPIFKPIYIHLMKQVDGFICVSKMQQELVLKLCPTAKTAYVPQHIKPDVRKRILSEKPAALDNHRIIMIAFGHSVYYKGLDLAIETFLKVKNKIPDAEFTIVGKWDEETKVKYSVMDPGIKFAGVVKNIVPVIKDSSLSLHMARGEGFGVNIIETMLAGVPNIVSDATGAKEAVELVDKRLIVPLDTDIAANRVIKYFSLPYSKKKELARRSIKVARKYTRKAGIAAFRKAYARFIEY